MSYRGLGTTTTLNYPGMPSGEPFTMNVQGADSIDLLTGPDDNSYTRLQIGGGYLGAPMTSPEGGYAGIQTVNGPGSSAFNFANWVKANSTTVYLAAGAFVLMSMFGGRR